MAIATESVKIPYLSSEADVITFENGHRLVFVSKPGSVFNISTWIKTGSIHETAENNGVSHFLEHLMFKGTERFAPGDFDKAMESMGAVINAATWKDFTFYYVTGPVGERQKTSLGENFARALDMHADMMLYSTLPEKEIGPQYDPFDENYAGEKRERSVVIEEISMREDQPWTKVYNTVNHMMYPDGHPYQRDVIGTRAIIGGIPRECIENYYDTWYSPNAMTTIVVGDFEFELLKSQVAKTFNFPQKKQTNPPFKTTQDFSLKNFVPESRYAEITGDYQTAFFLQGYHGPTPENLKETIALDIVCHALSDGRSARLVQTFIEKPEKPIFNYIGCDQSTFKLGNVFFAQGNFNVTGHDKTPKEVLDLMTAEIEALLTTHPLTQEEFDRAYKYLKVGFAQTSETAAGIAETIGESLTVTNSLESYTHYLETLQGLTLEAVNAIARQYLTADKAFTAVMVPTSAQ
ncbi:MAG: pitrilysin family protein [Cyanobacteria bacterium P01_H01_bin.74]